MAKWQNAPVVDTPRWAEAPLVERPPVQERLQAAQARQKAATERLGSFPSLYDAPLTAEQQRRYDSDVDRMAQTGLTGLGQAEIVARQAYKTPDPQASIKREMDRRRYRGFLDELGVSLESGGETAVGGVLGTVGQGLRTLARNEVFWPLTRLAPLQRQASGIDIQGRDLDKWAQTIYEDTQRWQAQPGAGGGLAGFIANAAGRTVPYFAVATVAGIVGGPGATWAVTAAIEGDSAYRDAISQGATEEEAQLERIIVGSVNGVIEMAQVGEVLKMGQGASAVALKEFKDAVAERAWKKVAKATGKLSLNQLVMAVNEGAEEVAQEWVGAGAARIIHDQPMEDMGYRTGMAFAGGMVGGGLLGGGSLVIETALTQATEEVEEAGEAQGPPEIGPGGVGFTPRIQGGMTADEMVERLGGETVALEDLGAAVQRAAVDAETKAKLEELFGKKIEVRHEEASPAKEAAPAAAVPAEGAAPGVEAAPGEVTTAAEPKQPWEMMSGEYIVSRIGKADKRDAARLQDERQTRAAHEGWVKVALKEGNPVPRAVLEEYKGEPWADAALAKLEEKPKAKEPQPKPKKPEAKAATDLASANEIITPIPGDLGIVRVRKTAEGRYESGGAVDQRGRTVPFPPSGPFDTPQEAMKSILKRIRNIVPPGTTALMEDEFREAWGLAEEKKPLAPEAPKVVESKPQEISDEAAAEPTGVESVRRGEATPPEETPAKPPQVSEGAGEGPGVRPKRPRTGGTVSRQSQRRGKADTGDVGRDTGDVDQPAGRRPPSRRPDSSGGQHDYRITDADDIEAGGDRTKYKANIDAIRTLKKIEAEGRLATPEEQAILVKYTGWGGLKNAFEGYQRGWEDAPRELQELLSEEEYKSARRSTANAHYTSPKVVKAMWEGLQKLGFKGGRINEPAIGTGIFYGLIPDDIAAKSRLFGVELDEVSARIAKQLYQSASIENKGFQDVRYPDNFFDLFISNVPFDEKTHPYDPDMPRNLNFNLHDFYFAKALKKTRPGGLIAFITSKGTMDKGNPAMRKWMAKQADFVGAVRLPRTAFGKIAGTEVVTDIIVFQKRTPGQENRSQAFENIVGFEQEGQTYNINEYFAAHPEQILGKLSYEGSMYGANEMTVDDTGIDLASAAEIIGQFKVPTDINAEAVRKDEEMHQPEYERVAPENVKEGAYVVQNDDIYQNVDGILTKATIPKASKGRFKRMIAIRDAARHLISLQINPEATDKQVEAARKALNKQYDSFVAKNKAFHDRYNQRIFAEETDFPLLLALENWDNETKTAKKAKIFTERTQFPRHQITSADSASDAIAVSMSEKARLDVDYIASLLGIKTDEVLDQIRGYAYENPETGVWEPAFLYLAGNVRKKLAAARAAAELDPKYKPNVEALEAAQPEDLGAEEISVRLGSSWIPPSVYDAFATHLIGHRAIRVTAMPHDGSWVVEGRGSHPQWETGEWKTSELIDSILNHKQPRVYWKDEDGNRHVDEEATAAAQLMAERIKSEFENWIWQDPERTKALARLYNDGFNNTVQPKWDGSYLQFPGMSHSVLEGGKLRPHQVNAVARFLTWGNLLLAHAVGAGKTYAGVAMAMEARRTGLAKKPVFVVPNHKIDDWRVDFMKLYPSANILAATKKDFERKNRQKLMNQIATGDWDAVIVPMTSFERIQMSPGRVRDFFQDQIDELDLMIRQAKADKSDKSITKQLEKSKSALQERLKKMEASWKKDPGPYFDELGIDMMFVDEAHAYKNLFFTTQMERISGLQNSYTQRSFDMLLKTKYLNEITNHRGIIFATGTPITNTIGEMYTMQRYLQPQILREAGISAFDSWATNFGDTVTDVEVDPTGGGFRLNTRFAKFTNLPELMQMFGTVADIVTKKQMGIPLPKIKGAKPTTIQSEPTDDVRDYIASLVVRAKDFKAGHVKPNVDNMLKITNDGRHVALDARLRVPGASDQPGSKINQCVEHVKEVYDRTEADKGTQVIWCDLSTPGKGWSIYDELKQKLIDAGIPERQIAFIHDAKDEKQQATLYDRMNRGDLRVIVASTEKMGTGANVQRRLKAAHHLTAPWRPADIEQRDGRIERQGNMYDEIEIYQYVTKGTFDAYMWQTLETKAKFIEQALTGEGGAREVEDVSKTSLTFAEIKALSSGNPKILEAIKLDAEVKKLESQEKAHRAEQIRIREAVHSELPAEIRRRKEQVKVAHKDAKKAVEALEKAGKDVDLTIADVHYTTRKEAGEALAKAISTIRLFHKDYWSEVGSAYGFPIRVKWYQPLSLGEGFWRLQLVGEASAIVSHETSLGKSDTGSVTRIINEIERMEDTAKQLEATLKANEQRLLEMQKLVNQPFDKAEELRTKKENLRRLQAELQQQVQPVAQPQPEPQAPIEPEPVPLNEAIASKDFDTLKELLAVGQDANRQRFEEITGIVLPDTEPGTENVIGEFVRGEADRYRRQSGRTTLIPDAAAELAAISRRLTGGPASLVGSAVRMFRRNIVSVNRYLRTMGGAGRLIAYDFDVITHAVTKQANNDKADLRKLFHGVSREQLRRAAMVVNERLDPKSQPKKVVDLANRMRQILDRSMNEANALGMTRKVRGKRIPIGGIGKAFPQVPNAKGVAFLKDAKVKGKGSSQVFTWAQEQVKAGRFQDVDEAIIALQQFRDQQLRAVNRYFESSRVELPVDMIEWDPVKILPHLIDRNWMTIEGVRQWGVEKHGQSFPLLRSRIERIRRDYGSDAAQRIENYVQVAFGGRSPASQQAEDISRRVRGFQFITKVGISPITIIRNMADRLPKGMAISPLGTIRAAIDYPPFVNGFIEAAQKLEERMVRAGVVFGHGSLSEGYEAGSFFSELLGGPFSESERGNQVFIATVAYHKLMHDIAILERKGVDVTGRLLERVAAVFGQSRAQAAYRVGPDIEATILAGQEVSQEQIENFLAEAVSKNAFPMLLNTKPVWYETHPLMKVLAQFKTWPIRQTNLIYQDVLKYTVKTGDFTRLIGFLIGTLLAGEIYNLLRDWLFRKDESLLSQLRKDPESRRIGWAIFNDLIDGGGVGMVADFTYGIFDWAKGVSWTTGERVVDFAKYVREDWRLTPQALENLVKWEVAPYRQLKGLYSRLDTAFNRDNMSKPYHMASAEAWRWKDAKEHPTAGSKIGAYADDVIWGKPDYGIGENTLAYELASRQIVAGDIGDAAKYLGYILSRAEDRKKALAGIRQSMNHRSPLGAIAERDRPAFLKSLSPETRTQIVNVQRNYLRSYNEALRQAQRNTR